MTARPLEGRYIEEAVYLYQLGTPWTPSTTIIIQPEEVFAKLTAPNAQFWVFVDDDDKVQAMAGFENIQPIDRTAEPYVVVSEDNQNTGLGWKISQFLFERRLTLNLRRIQSIVLEDSPSAKFLVKLGFKQEGVLNAMRLREGQPVNGLVFGWVKE